MRIPNECGHGFSKVGLLVPAGLGWARRLTVVFRGGVGDPNASRLVTRVGEGGLKVLVDVVEILAGRAPEVCRGRFRLSVCWIFW